MARTSDAGDGARAARTLVGASAAGTTAADAPPPAPEPPSREARRFRLRADERVADGIRRAARGQLADSVDALAGETNRAALAEAVHETRKSIKRVRTTLRLSRQAIGEEAYADENAELRSIAGRLAEVRDAHVLVETLATLEQRFAGELPPAATELLRERLHDEHERASAKLAEDGDLATATRQALEEARERTAGRHFDSDGFDALAPGLRRIYAGGRKRMRAAREEPEEAERLHDARKRVKDLWHAAQLLRGAHPKRMERLARDAHELSSLLGDHHDLSVLREYAEANPQLFSDMASREALLTVIDRRREALARQALKRGRRLYRRGPKRFVEHIERGWRKRVGSQAGGIAG